MLYAAMLATAGLLYGDGGLIKLSESVRDTIRTQAFDGSFFVDNAVRQNGQLRVTTNHTEVCQYYAFYFDVATPGTYPQLWDMLRDQFGPQRSESNSHSDVHPANSFVGNYLRLELLSRYGLCKQLLRESHDYFLYMVDRTGTLWENDDTRASCNHGFASHVVRLLYRDVLGVYEIDINNRTITLRFSDLDLKWARGSIPLREGPISLCWWHQDEQLHYKITYPSGFRLRSEHLNKRPIVRQP